MYLCESTISDDEANDSLCNVAASPVSDDVSLKFAGPGGRRKKKKLPFGYIQKANGNAKEILK